MMLARTPKPKRPVVPKEPMPTALRQAVDNLAKRTGKKTVSQVVDSKTEKDSRKA